MIIYRVKEGESVFDVAAKFNTSVKRLAADNELVRTMPLTEGQDLLIMSPISTYVVSVGDTVEKIISDFSIDKEELLQNNPELSSNWNLHIGQELVINGEKSKFGKMKVMSSLKPNVDRNIAAKIMPYLTFASIRSCALRSDGSVFMQNDNEIRALAKEHGVAPIMEIQPASMFDKSWWSVLSSYDMISRVANNVKQMTLSSGYRGVNLNFGNVPEEIFDSYVELVSTVKDMLSPWGVNVISTVPESTIISMDMELLADAADTLTIFPKNIYDDLMDVLEIEDLTRLLSEVAESSQISLCLPMTAVDVSLGRGGEILRKEKLSSSQALRVAIEKQTPIIYDDTSCLAEYDYLDMERGSLVRHKVTYECLESLHEIVCMGKELGVGMLSVFNADKYYAPFWTMLASLYDIEKIH